jgi:hypothetical protein
MRGKLKFVLGGLFLAWLGVFAPAQVNVSAPASVKDQASSATGSAAPSTAIYTGANSSGNLTGVVACDTSVQLTVSTATTTQAIALVAGKTIYVCGFVMNGAGATTTKLVYGTGTNCATGQTALTPSFTLASGTNVTFGGAFGYVTKTASANALCVTNSAAIAASVLLTYTQF